MAKPECGRNVSKATKHVSDYDQVYNVGTAFSFGRVYIRDVIIIFFNTHITFGQNKLYKKGKIIIQFVTILKALLEFEKFMLF